ncbi:MAG: hypothetical protein HYT61_02720 [Candidatus Yanofskybacteria bacterium]|nr:hypothetical protein [Candidatus Yanofskybacteria bacterium]
MKHNDKQIDDLIRLRVQDLSRPKYLIEPPADFTRQVMAKIGMINRRQRWTGYFLAVVLSMVPLAVREAWLLVRGDYFSVSGLPFGQLVVGAYEFFLSPAALYVLLALGILAFLLRASKLRRGLDNSFIRIA